MRLGHYNFYKNTLIGSTKENVDLLDVLPFESVYRKIIIVYIIKNIEFYLDKKMVIVKRENRAFDVRMDILKKHLVKNE